MDFNHRDLKFNSHKFEKLDYKVFKGSKIKTNFMTITVGLTAFVKLGFSQKNFIVSKVGGGQVM